MNIGSSLLDIGYSRSDNKDRLPIPAEQGIVRQQAHGLGHCLRKKNPVERILVTAGQGFNGGGMNRSHRQLKISGIANAVEQIRAGNRHLFRRQ